jgi:hypothetical protein
MAESNPLFEHLAKDTTVHPMGESRCPGCGKVHDATLCPDGSAPAPGDLMICAGCGTYLKFGERLQSVALSDGEFAALDADDQLALREARATWEAFQGPRGAAS